MYLKKIEMLGFKSFLDRTEFVFEPGIAAIVGPNGCGKTNVVDAIRWVLGEQSAHALRGSRMEDVIFNGTEEKKPLGIAEVSLTISNEGNPLPVDYSEVMVTRRVFRSGEGEYFINKVPCRLKDINELFMDTGIGTKAYSIIEQGKVDLILSSKPEDRRFIFEEAAGIMKVKVRKREAMRKLESTEQNLLRINDVISEVKRQIGSLQRQVGKAKRYQQLSEQLKEFEITLALDEYRSLSENLRSCEEELENLRKLVEGMNSDVGKSEDSVEELRRALTETENELTDVWEERRTIGERIIQSENDIVLHKDRIKGCNLRGENVRSEIEVLKGKLSSVIDELSAFEGREKELEGEGENRQKEIDEGEERLISLADELKKKEKELAKIKEELIGTAAILARKRSELASLTAVNKNYLAREERLKIEQSNDLQDKETYEDEFTKVTEAWGKNKEEISIKETHLKTLDVRISTLRENLDRIQESIHSQRGELNSRKSNLELIEGMIQNYEGYSGGVRAVMSAGDSLEGICGAAGDLLNCPEDFQVAIEAVLGEKAQFIFVENAKYAESAIQYLREKDCGRAVFLPLDSIKEIKSDFHIPSNADVIGAALEKVRFDARHESAFRFLLGKVIIVRNLGDAIELISEAGEGWQIVTLEGEVISASGLISGGRIPSRGAGLIGRSERVDELKKLIEKLVESINHLEGNERELASELESCSADSGVMAEELRVEKEKFASLESTRTKLQIELERLTEDLSVVEDEIVVVGKDRDRCKVEVQELTSEIEGIASEEDGYNQDMHSIQQYLDDGAKEREEILARLTSAKITLASLEERKESLKASFSLRQNAHSEYEENLSKLTEEIKESAGQVKEFESAIIGVENELKELAVKKSEVEENMSKIEDSKKKITVGIQERENALREKRKFLEEKQSEMHKFDVRHAEYKMQIDSLTEKMSSRYRVSLVTLVGQRAVEEVDVQMISEEVVRLRAKLEAMGAVNLVAIEEYKELEERYNFVCEQREDLLSAKESLQKTIDKIDQTTKSMFVETFRQINENFGKLFKDLFGGGKAELILLDEKNVLETGIEIIARPPGKKLQSISLLSGGEKAMTAIALLFSVMRVKPSPFCILDEIDAALDDANIGRFVELVKGFAKDSQFIVITHSKATIASSDIIYGVTMEERGVSKKIGVRFAEEGNSFNVSSEVEGTGREKIPLK